MALPLHRRMNIRRGGWLPGVSDVSVPQTTQTVAVADSADPVITGAWPLVYTVTYTNTGSVDATTVSVVVTLDSSLAYVSSSGTGWSINQSGQTVTCTRATAAAGAAPAITINTTTGAAGVTATTSAAATASNAPSANGSQNTTVSLVTKDATSGKYIPSAVAEANSLVAVAGLSGTTLGLYLFGAPASGNVSDSSGNSKTLTASGTLSYQQTVAGWTAKSLKTTNNTAGKAINNAYGNVNATNYTILLWALESNFTGAVTRTLFRIGTTFDDDACFEIVNATTNKPKIGEGDGTRSTGAQTVAGSVRPYVLRVDDTGNQIDGFTDQEKIVGGTQACNGTELCFGGDNVQTLMPPGCDYIYAWVLGSALSDANLKTLLQTAGWTIAW